MDTDQKCKGARVRSVVDYLVVEHENGEKFKYMYVRRAWELQIIAQYGRKTNGQELEGIGGVGSCTDEESINEKWEENKKENLRIDGQKYSRNFRVVGTHIGTVDTEM